MMVCRLHKSSIRVLPLKGDVVLRVLMFLYGKCACSTLYTWYPDEGASDSNRLKTDPVP